MTDWITFSPRTKSILLLVCTLLLGVLLGAVLNTWLAQERFERIQALRSAQGFERMVERSVAPVSDEQSEQISIVMEEWGPRIVQQRREHRRETRALMDSVRTDLRPILSDEQMERLEERLRPRGRYRGEQRLRRGPDREERPQSNNPNR